jgi:hypothetical protein
VIRLSKIELILIRLTLKHHNIWEGKHNTNRESCNIKNIKDRLYEPYLLIIKMLAINTINEC